MSVSKELLTQEYPGSAVAEPRPIETCNGPSDTEWVHATGQTARSCRPKTSAYVRGQLDPQT